MRALRAFDSDSHSYYVNCHSAILPTGYWDKPCIPRKPAKPKWLEIGCCLHTRHTLLRALVDTLAAARHWPQSRTSTGIPCKWKYIDKRIAFPLVDIKAVHYHGSMNACRTLSHRLKASRSGAAAAPAAAKAIAAATLARKTPETPRYP